MEGDGDIVKKFGADSSESNSDKIDNNEAVFISCYHLNASNVSFPLRLQ